MSTPTPSQLAAVPSPASKKPGLHNVSTPTAAYGLSSPAPRSVPSPATTRKDLSGKTPMAHGTTGSSSGSKTVGGTPMMLNLSQQGSTASPMPVGFSGMTPTGLGVDLGTPGHLNLATPALGTGMVASLSELGFTSSGNLKRNEDEERRTRMRKILKTIGRSKGRVSEEGILRITRRLGLANDIDGENLRVEERERRLGNRTVGIAGNTLVVEVDLQKHLPTDVRVDFSNTMANASGKAERAGSMLLEDLKEQHAPQVNRMLDRFATNLERLTRFDRLSTPKISCFGALSGLHTSLKRLYEQEKAIAMKLYKDGSSCQEQAELQIINKGSGRPAIHEGGTMGLSLTYWSKRRGHSYKKDAEDAMDIDNKTNEEFATRPELRQKIWFETERCPSGLFPPIRITEAWLPHSLELSAIDPSSVPWRDPPLTYIPLDTDGANSMSDHASQPLPDIRFVARFDPPLVMPWQIAANLYSAVESSIPTAFQLPSYVAMLLGAPSGIVGNFLTTHAQVLRPSGDSFVDVRHTYNINVAKHELGFRLEELPFSHPRQIVGLLPILRQWLGINDLLLRHLKALSVVSSPAKAENSILGTSLLDSLLTDEGSKESDELPVEIVLVLAPEPTLSLTFALADGSLHHTDVQVLSNGELHVINAECGSAGEALDLCDDLGVWIEWLRTQAKTGN